MQVRESTEASKRSFLESKGLSKEKIDEAFKLAGVASPAPTAPVPSEPAKVPQAAPLVMAQQPQAQRPVRWTQVVLGAGVLAGGAYLARRALEGYAPSFLRRSDTASAASGSSGARKASSREEEIDALVAEMKLETKELKNSVDDLKQMFLDLEGSVTDFRATAGGQEEVGELRDELRVLTTTINQFASPEKQVAYEETLKEELSAIKSILSDIQTPGQRGRRPEGGAEFTPESGLSVPAGMAETEAVGSTSPRDPKPRLDDDPPRPHSYMEILELLEKNQTPPGIRTDIDDKVKVPNLDPTESAAEVPLKPWQRGAAASAEDSPLSLSADRKGKRALRPTGASPSSAAAELGEGSNSGWRPPPVPMSRLTSPISQDN